MLVFISTFVSPHTLPFGVEATKYYDKVVFINTMALTEERRRMGYDITSDRVEIFNLNENEKACRALIADARDVILSGTRFDLVNERIAAGGSVYIAHERLFKKGILKLADPRTWRIAAFCRSVRSKNVFLLSIGDFAAKDFRRLGFNKDKIFRFGYFPKTAQANPTEAQETISPECRILWVGRMVGFKRPIMALKAAKKLPEGFRLTMVGDGKLMPKVERFAAQYHVDVELLGNLPNTAVMELMKNADILLSTSDKGEGWGAVINEGMNCGCAIVCSDSIGCAGTLVNEKNAVIFPTHSTKALVGALLMAKENREELGRNGLSTIINEFNAAVAANRFSAIAGVEDKKLFADGICSKVF